MKAVTDIIDMSPKPAGRAIHIEIPVPLLGGKAWLLKDKGVFVLERGPGSLGTLAITHAGSGALIAYDGVPDDGGWFPDEAMAEDDPKFWARRGRPLYFANPVVMGSWWINAGFQHGLTIVAAGGHQGSSAIATVVWQKVKERAPGA